MLQRAPEVRFEPFGPRGGDLDAAVAVYADTWRRDFGASREFFRGYFRLPEYRGVLARNPVGEVLGMAFGTRSRPGDWWYDRIADEVGRDHPALADAFAVVELAVASAWRGRGVGASLLAHLLGSQPCPRALLSAAVSNVAAQRFYLRQGWSYLHRRGFVFGPGQPPYVVMCRELPPVPPNRDPRTF